MGRAAELFVLSHLVTYTVRPLVDLEAGNQTQKTVLDDVAVIQLFPTEITKNHPIVQSKIIAGIFFKCKCTSLIDS